jgi:hypothetical protein
MIHFKGSLVLLSKIQPSEMVGLAQERMRVQESKSSIFHTPYSSSISSFENFLKKETCMY